MSSRIIPTTRAAPRCRGVEASSPLSTSVSVHVCVFRIWMVRGDQQATDVVVGREVHARVPVARVLLVYPTSGASACARIQTRTAHTMASPLAGFPSTKGISRTHAASCEPGVEVGLAIAVAIIGHAVTVEIRAHVQAELDLQVLDARHDLLIVEMRSKHSAALESLAAQCWNEWRRCSTAERCSTHYEISHSALGPQSGSTTMGPGAALLVNTRLAAPAWSYRPAFERHPPATASVLARRMIRVSVPANAPPATGVTGQPSV